MLAAIYEIELKLKSYPTWACYKSVELKCLPLLSANVIAIGFHILHRSENKKSCKGLDVLLYVIYLQQMLKLFSGTLRIA